ncbi:MAG TPA: hypothetical protein VJ927_08170 [Actinomycetota bacterium]|nr:hypothetical protein [Actinomycetota bacterium]
MSYVSNDSNSSECDPRWVEWAERETINRLRDQLTELRVKRELRRVAEQQEAEVEDALVAPDEPTSPEPVVRQSLSAMNAPPDPEDPAWQAWAETQTVLRLRRQKEMRATASAPSAPPPDPAPAIGPTTEAERVPETRSELRFEVESRPTIRIHHDNLRTVGV